MQSWNVQITQLIVDWRRATRCPAASTLSVTQLMIRPILTDGRRRRPLGRRRRRPVTAGAEWRRPAVEEQHFDQHRQTVPARLRHRLWSTTDSDSSRYRASRQREAGSSTTADLRNKHEKSTHSLIIWPLNTWFWHPDSFRLPFPPSPSGSECTGSYGRVGAT